MNSEHLLRSLHVAVEAAPDDVPLRLHLAELLKVANRRAEAVRQAAAVLQRDPHNEAALRLITQDVGEQPTPAPASRETSSEADALRLVAPRTLVLRDGKVVARATPAQHTVVWAGAEEPVTFTRS